ncbi:hypothetical protein GDO81_013669 [Engystomops pustulosus]|uniref:Uncharacterized protein n=1 Tax=Engystomops pustulosus TaxID=76066 RepID=A0AAV7B188_ENGPU|nr:hypothetical protein GDO81_013669 [Engystomops pustulosus]
MAKGRIKKRSPLKLTRFFPASESTQDGTAQGEQVEQETCVNEEVRASPDPGQDNLLLAEPLLLLESSSSLSASPAIRGNTESALDVAIPVTPTPALLDTPQRGSTVTEVSAHECPAGPISSSIVSAGLSDSGPITVAATKLMLLDLQTNITKER